MKLADLSNIQFISGYPRDLAKELGPDGITTLLRIICEAYKELRASGRVTSIMSETEITEELYVELLDVWKKTKIPLKPIHEKSHGKRKEGRGKTPTIDFCFRTWDPNSYFGAECKLLEENNSEHYKLYVDEGVNRYLSGKYGEKCSAGSMIGYIIIGNTAEIINKVKIKVDELPNIFSDMKKSDSINGFNEHYKSVHERRVENTPFHIHHLFFSFT